MQNMKNLQTLLTSNKLSIKLKMRLFNTYLSSIMLYNSELWTMTKSLEKKTRCLSEEITQENTKIKLAKTLFKRKATPHYKNRALEHHHPKKKT